MPLIIICGYPSSGKTTVRKQITKYMEDIMKKTVTVISENDIVDERKNEIYGDSLQEKPVRSSLRADVERYISRDNIVIVDSLNYIKSFRYELFCIMKAVKTLHCVIQCGFSTQTCSNWNEQRPTSEKYTKEIFDALVLRFEEPDGRNRWDSPLFTITMETELDMVAVYNALYNRTAKPPNQSTMPTPLTAGNFMHDLDQITLEIIMEVLELQKACGVGDSILISGSNERIVLLKTLTMAELRRIKRQFINYAKMHPIEDLAKLKNMFVKFLNNSIQ